jgi:hypothetical protein
MLLLSPVGQQRAPLYVYFISHVSLSLCFCSALAGAGRDRALFVCAFSLLCDGQHYSTQAQQLTQSPGMNTCNVESWMPHENRRGGHLSLTLCFCVDREKLKNSKNRDTT